MKREALILALLLCQPAYAQNTVEDGTKTDGLTPEQSLVERHKKQFQIAKQVQQDPMAVQQPALPINAPVEAPKKEVTEPRDMTWKRIGKATWHYTKRGAWGLQFWKAEVWATNWRDTTNWLEQNDRKTATVSNGIGSAWYCTKFGL